MSIGREDGVMGDIGRWAAGCWNCGGTGWLGARHDEDECACPQCDGVGKIEVVRASDYLRAVKAHEARAELDDAEQAVMDHILAAMQGIQSLGLKTNHAE